MRNYILSSLIIALLTSSCISCMDQIPPGALETREFIVPREVPGGSTATPLFGGTQEAFAPEAAFIDPYVSMHSAARSLRPLPSGIIQVILDNLPEEVSRALESFFKSGGNNFIVLKGQPGTGKTTIAQALGLSSFTEFKALNATSLITTYQASGEKTLDNDLDDIIKRAKNDEEMRGKKKYLVLIDEIDQVVGYNSGSDDKAESLPKHLKDKIDESPRNILYIGTTNRADKLNHALMTHSATCIEIACPSRDYRATILRVLLNGQEDPDFQCSIVQNDKVFDQFVGKLEGVSIRELINIVTLAKGFALVRCQKPDSSLGELYRQNRLRQPQEYPMTRADEHVEQKVELTEQDFAGGMAQYKAEKQVQKGSAINAFLTEGYKIANRLLPLVSLATDVARSASVLRKQKEHFQVQQDQWSKDTAQTCVGMVQSAQQFVKESKAKNEEAAKQEKQKDEHFESQKKQSTEAATTKRHKGYFSAAMSGASIGITCGLPGGVVGVVCGTVVGGIVGLASSYAAAHL